MAYNKDNYDNQRLTPKQEIFVEEIAKGKSQYEAYTTAYQPPSGRISCSQYSIGLQDRTETNQKAHIRHA